jgi:hypothetical protein
MLGMPTLVEIALDEEELVGSEDEKDTGREREDEEQRASENDEEKRVETTELSDDELDGAAGGKKDKIP